MKNSTNFLLIYFPTWLYLNLLGISVIFALKFLRWNRICWKAMKNLQITEVKSQRRSRNTSKIFHIFSWNRRNRSEFSIFSRIKFPSQNLNKFSDFPPLFFFHSSDVIRSAVHCSSLFSFVGGHGHNSAPQTVDGLSIGYIGLPCCPVIGSYSLFIPRAK